MKKFTKVLALTLAVGMSLTACKPADGGKTGSTDAGNTNSTEVVSKDNGESKINWDAKSLPVKNEG